MSTAIAVEVPEGAAARARWALADSWVVARRDMLHWVAQPGQIVAGLLFPIVFVILYGYVFGSAIVVPGGGDYREFLMPGLFVMTMAFGIGETMVAVNTDLARGVTDRFRSMPMSPAAVVVGRSMADILYATVGLGLMVICGLVVGWRAEDGFMRAAAAIGLLLMLRFAFLWVGILIGLMVRSPEATGAVWGLLFPFTMISNAFVAPDLMPGWLGAVAEWNPLSATVSATRDLFGNPGAAGGSWIAEHAMVMAVVWPIVIVAVFLPLAVRRYWRLGR